MAVISAPRRTAPSYKTGYARSAFQCANPSLQKSLFGGWIPALGNVGDGLRDIMGKNHGTFLSSTVPVWAKSGIPSESQEVLEWGSEVNNSAVSLGNMPNFLFKQLEVWSVITSFSIAECASDARTLIAKYGTGSDRQFRLITDQQTAPTNLEVWTGATLTLNSGDVIELDTWYTACVTNDGTGLDNSVSLRVFDTSGSRLGILADWDHKGNSADFSQPVSLGGNIANNFDEFRGELGATYFYTKMLSVPEQRLVARDNLAPIRLKPRMFPIPAAVGGVVASPYYYESLLAG